MELNAATLDEVRAILIETLGIADRGDTLTADAALLGAVPELDSLAVVEVMTSIEERFGFQIDEESFSGRSSRCGRKPGAVRRRASDR